MKTSMRATIKFIVFALLCLAVIPVQSLILLITKGPAAYIVPRLWHKAVCTIFGIKITVSGQPAQNAQTMYVSNHISYLDIPAAASIIKNVSFVAKSEVASWPLFGFLSKLQQTAFISRSRSDAAKESRNLESMLKIGKSLFLFAEGTSTDGTEVRPFKSSLFSLPLQPEFKHLQIQPVTIKVLRADGKRPETQESRDIYSWHINMDTPLEEHLWRFAGKKGAEIEITFHPPLLAGEYNDRKILAEICCKTVREGLAFSSQNC